MATITKIDADGRTIPKGSAVRTARYRARWRTPSGASRSQTFTRKIDAEQHLTTVEGSKLSGGFVDLAAGAVTLDPFTARWLEVRRTSSGQPLRPKTRALYDHLYARHVAPTFGHVRIRDIAPGDVREWHGRLAGETVPAKSYRLLRAVLNTAVDDGLIGRNPCRISGAGVERSPERPVPTGDEVWELADRIGERWRTLVLTSAFAGLRWGELIGLRRGDIDVDAATIRVQRQVIEVGRDQLEGPPKTEAGLRIVAVPMVLVPELRPISTGSSGRSRRRGCWSVRPVPRRGRATSGRSGDESAPRSGGRISTSTICGTSRTRSPRPRELRRRN